MGLRPRPGAAQERWKDSHSNGSLLLPLGRQQDFDRLAGPLAINEKNIASTPLECSRDESILQGIGVSSISGMTQTTGDVSRQPKLGSRRLAFQPDFRHRALRRATALAIPAQTGFYAGQQRDARQTACNFFLHRSLQMRSAICVRGQGAAGVGMMR